MSLPCIGILVPMGARTPQLPPEALPFGRAALAARARGLDVVLGEHGETCGELVGYRVKPGLWVDAKVQPGAIFDRFRDQSFPQRYAAAQSRLGHLPWANAPAITRLCRDKLESQRILEGTVAMPEICEADGGTLPAGWTGGFAKPRYGSFGRSVSAVAPGEPIPLVLEGMRGEPEQPALVQRAIRPPGPHAGISVRILVQREGQGWVTCTPVARMHPHDPVVNVARGATVAPAIDILGEAWVDRARAMATQAAEVLSAHGLLLEVGVDLVPDAAGGAWVIEVNGRPRGRLAALGEAWKREHEEACVRPLLELSRSSSGPPIRAEAR